jgi:hypothetical protein
MHSRRSPSKQKINFDETRKISIATLNQNSKETRGRQGNVHPEDVNSSVLQTQRRQYVLNKLRNLTSVPIDPFI